MLMRFSWPTCAGSSIRSPRQSPTSKDARMANETILVVEDSRTEMGLLVESLRQRGYRVVTAADGEEALAKVASERPRLILLDVILPKKNGFQVCRLLKSAPATRDVKIVFVTAKT